MPSSGSFRTFWVRGSSQASLIRSVRIEGTEIDGYALPDPLRSGRTLQLEIDTGSTLSSGTAHCILKIRMLPCYFFLLHYINLDGPEDRCCKEEGRFPDSLARVNGPWIRSPSEEADVELGGHVVEAGDLVGARASGEEGTLGGVKQLLHNKKTVTLV